MVPTIDTVDYNKRMIAISNNDTTGRWPVKAPYPLPEPYCRTTESLLLRKSIFHENGNTWRNPKGANDSKITREVTKWNAADSTVKAIPAYSLYSQLRSPGKACIVCACLQTNRHCIKLGKTYRCISVSRYSSRT
jgi:hypothetical protein